MTPTQLIYQNTHFTLEPHDGICATCAAPITRGVSTDEVNNKTFSQHSDFFKFGTHVCEACAWMYYDPKRAHRNLLAVGEKVYWPMISQDSATSERPSWLDLLTKLKKLSPKTICCGVLTSDPKPRKWPLMQMATLESFGLVVHAPDYDISGYHEFSLAETLEIAQIINQALEQKYTKRDCFLGLPRNYKLFRKDSAKCLELEATLSTMRLSTAFLPALLIAGIKGENNGDTQNPNPSTAASSEAVQEEPRLF